MKKFISLIIVSLALSLSVFAGSWKSYDLLKASKLQKLIDNYALNLVEDTADVSVYKSDDSIDWIYIYKIGSEKEGTQTVYYTVFANIDGKFDSCTRYGQLLAPATPYQYIYGGIDESNTAVANVPVESAFSAGAYVWKDPNAIYLNLFYIRLVIFTDLYNNLDNYGISIPENVLERYSYFSSFYKENQEDEKFKSLLPKEYKAYIKENPLN